MILEVNEDTETDTEILLADFVILLPSLDCSVLASVLCTSVKYLCLYIYLYWFGVFCVLVADSYLDRAYSTHHREHF